MTDTLRARTSSGATASHLSNDDPVVRQTSRADHLRSGEPFDGRDGYDPYDTKPMDPDASVGDLISRVTDDFSQLVSTHVELAKVEIKDEIARAGKGAGMLTAGAVSALFALLMLSLALAWALAEIMDAGFAFLIVGLLWGIGAAFLAMTGRKELQTVSPVPEVTKQTVQDDVQWAKEQR